jgi:hypothetical protein
MKFLIHKAVSRLALPVCLVGCILLSANRLYSQEDSTVVVEEAVEEETPKAKPVKNTFQSVWIIDNQTVMVPVKGTLEMDIMHRFGTWNKGYDDLFGFFAPSNIRLGVNYAPINKLFVGFGITKEAMVWDGNLKYSIITQTKGKYPVSVSYYVNAAFDSRKFFTIPIIKPDGAREDIKFKHTSDRFLFFHQLIIARKITDKFSLQVAPSVSHQNAVGGYYTKNDSTGTETYTNMKHSHYAVSVAARYKLTNVTSVIFNYDQPLTKHPVSNPNPNLALGVEFNTSSHSFQLFFGNYASLNPARNNLYNSNDPLRKNASSSGLPSSEFLIGFNITRLWNY